MFSLIPLLFGIALAQEPTLPYDCLANVCLNAKGAPSKSVVTVSDHRWTRTIEVCSGRIVSINISTGWEKPGFAWSSLLPETSTKMGNLDDRTVAVPLVDRTYRALADKDWRPLTPEYDNDGLTTRRIWNNPNLQGVRFTVFTDTRQGGMWAYGIGTVHPEYHILCRPLHSQGL